MQFQVPQFIDIEDKLFGPLTLVQFIYLLGGGGIVFVLYKFLPIVIALPLMIVIGGFSLALAFYKVNNRSFIFALQAGIKYFISPKMFVWHKASGTGKTPVSVVAKKTETQIEQTVDRATIRDLAWSLDALDRSRTPGE
ncbi:MAG: PrgI family protein [Candidatus Nomurabacteria bacterium]|nr:PrgI family protein [Candidatus Nomurabacteria bacterium]